MTNLNLPPQIEMSPNAQFVLQQILIQMRFLCNTVTLFAATLNRNKSEGCVDSSEAPLPRPANNEADLEAPKIASNKETNQGFRCKLNCPSLVAPRAISIFDCLFEQTQLPIHPVVISIYDCLLASGPLVACLQTNSKVSLLPFANAHNSHNSTHNSTHYCVASVQRLNKQECKLAFCGNHVDKVHGNPSTSICDEHIMRDHGNPSRSIRGEHIKKAHGNPATSICEEHINKERGNLSRSICEEHVKKAHGNPATSICEEHLNQAHGNLSQSICVERIDKAHEILFLKSRA